MTATVKDNDADQPRTQAMYSESKSMPEGRSVSLCPQQRFRKGHDPRPNDIFIAVMGVTGTGKSSLISLLCRDQAPVGHGLASQTSSVDVYAYELSPDRTVYLIDTPGFDDTYRSDTEILRDIAAWLTESYTHKIQLHGIIYLHRIDAVRFQGSAKKNLVMFKKLCGNDPLQKVILATTMWDLVTEEEGETREKQLINTQDAWGFMVSRGSSVHRHHNTVDSAASLINQLIAIQRCVTLDVQTQMVVEQKTLDQTAAGIELLSEFLRAKEEWARELQQAKEELQETIRLRNKEAEEAEETLRLVRLDYLQRFERLEYETRELHVTMQRLHEERIERLEKALHDQSSTRYAVERQVLRDAPHSISRRPTDIDSSPRYGMSRRTTTTPVSSYREYGRRQVPASPTSSVGDLAAVQRPARSGPSYGQRGDGDGG